MISIQNHLNEDDLNQNRDFDFENHDFYLKIKIMPNSVCDTANEHALTCTREA